MHLVPLEVAIPAHALSTDKRTVTPSHVLDGGIGVEAVLTGFALQVAYFHRGHHREQLFPVEAHVAIEHEPALLVDEYRADNQHDGNRELQANQADAEGLALLRGAKGASQGEGGIERGGEQGRIKAGGH